MEHLNGLEEDLQRFRDPIVLGDLDGDLEEARRLRISDLLAEYGLIDLVQQFRQRRRLYDLKTWSQVSQCTVLQSRCDYILGTDRHRFEIVGTRSIRPYSDFCILLYR